MNINDFRYREWKEFLEKNYDKEYMNAIAKLAAIDAYDSNGNLKENFVLTEAENNALLAHHKEPYKVFLDDVKSYTIETAKLYEYNKENDVTWKIVGVEYNKMYLIKKYGIAVYNRADAEARHKCNSNERNFATANRKLARLVHEGISASLVIDLDLLQKLLIEKNIPSYIDYEENIFHYNAIKHVKKKKNKTT